MPKGQEVLEELLRQSEATGAAHKKASAEYAASLDANTIAEALEKAIVAVFQSQTYFGLKRVRTALKSSPRWAQWRSALAEVYLPDDDCLKGACLMDPSIYHEARKLESNLDKVDLFLRAIALVEPQEDWRSDIPPLVVVDGSFCGSPFRPHCIHFEAPPSAT